MDKPRKIELLSPAKNLICGVEAIKQGADAVYIGAPQFSARAAAGNTLTDIAQLIRYAHQYYAKVYVALNTILTDSELEEAVQLIKQLYEIGTDALIIQDVGLLETDLPPIELHASTQMDNRTVEKVAFLAQTGFSQVVLARELSLAQIKEISSHTNVRLEYFVHGALCVSYSGQCYLSEACAGRSANRGNCAQYCRLPYTLIDADKHVVAANQHLLSLKDLNQSDNLEQLIDAGITSFKIEGRLKEVNYVKNITAWYRQKLDKILEQRHDCFKSSSGSCRFFFTPNPAKSFNRGFTSYFLHHREKELISPYTPKSIGEYIGTVKRSRQNKIELQTTATLHNGDGFCYLDKQHRFNGFRADRAELNVLYTTDAIKTLEPGVMLYRNVDLNFEQTLKKESAERKIQLNLLLRDNDIPEGYILQWTDEDNVSIEYTVIRPKEKALKPQQEQIKRILGKLGDTPFKLRNIRFELSDNFFIPASILAQWRRESIEQLIAAREQKRIERKEAVPPIQIIPLSAKHLTYLGNVYNRKARLFYQKRGVETIDNAYETQPVNHAVVMHTKYCLLYQLGMCKKKHEKNNWKAPFTLVYDKVRLLVECDCKACEMKLYKID